MPCITLEGPIIKDLDIKRRLVKEITDAAIRAYGLPEEVFIVFIKENSQENIGVGGQLTLHRRTNKSD